MKICKDAFSLGKNPLSHHYQGSIDFDTFNINRTLWMDFLLFPDYDIE